MFVDEEIEINLVNNCVKWYEEKGYDINSLRVKDKQNRMVIPKGTKITVKIKDIPHQSGIKVLVQCEYCGKQYLKHIRDYYKNIESSLVHKNCCENCKKYKNEEVSMVKFGERNPLCVKEIREKAKQTNMKRYGVEHALQNENIKKKATNTLMKNYGVIVPTRNKNIKEKIKQTNLNRYGVEYYQQSDESKKYQREERRTDFDKIKQDFKNENFTLLINESEYQNSSQAMKCICNNHPDIIQFKKHNHLVSGHGCKYCWYDKNVGENTYNWKGGITPLKKHFRSLLVQWKKESMHKCLYKCIITGKEFNAIHHLYSFDLILQETQNMLQSNYNINNMTINDISQTDIHKFNDIFLKNHNSYSLGICLCDNVHKLFHNTYGYGNNTPEQFYELSIYFILI